MTGSTGSSRWAGLREAAALARPHRASLALALVLGLLGGAAGLAQPLGAREVIEALGDDAPLTEPLLLLGVLVVISALFDTAHYWLLERTSERVVLGVRRRLADRLLRVRISAFDGLSPGDLAVRATGDATLLGQVASGSAVQLINGAVGLVGALALMAVVDVVLLIVTAGILASIGAGVLALLPRINRAMRRQQEATGRLGSDLDRSLGALRTIRAAGAEPAEVARLHVAAERSYRFGMRAAKAQAVVWVLISLTVQVAFIVVLGVGGARVASGELQIADLIAFLLYLFYLTGPVSELALGATQLQAGLAAIARIAEIELLDVEEPATPDARRPRKPPSGTAMPVVFDDVSFAYRPAGPLVLQGVSFEAPATGLTALVGPSGTGKTTVFSLLERFYDVDAGAVLVGGRDVRDWDRASLRARIAYVEQDTPVLAGTLRENLLLGAPEATERQLRDIVAKARLDDVVARSPGGLDAQIGSRGSTLSGGERQRIAIARALLRDARLLLLDEASSQLDADNERALRDTVAQLAADRAVLVIAHRLSTVTDADRIVVLDHGRVRAVGRHEELVDRDALYAGLAATQLGGDHRGR